MGMDKEKAEPKKGPGRPKKKPAGDFEDRLRLPFAPKSASMAGYRDKDGNEKTVKLKNGMYIIPKSVTGAKRLALIRELQAAGFEHERIVKGNKTKKAEPPARKFRIRYAHPDNEPDNPKSGEVKITIEEIEHDLTLDEHGTVVVDDADLQEYLADQGWIETDRTPIEE